MDQTIFDLRLYEDEVTALELRAQAEWESFYYATLPLDSITAGAPINTQLYPGTELLPTARFGSVTYLSVIHVKNLNPVPVASGAKLVRDLYYARGKGVVAFEEDGTGLWYRLP